MVADSPCTHGDRYRFIFRFTDTRTISFDRGSGRSLQRNERDHASNSIFRTIGKFL